MKISPASSSDLQAAFIALKAYLPKLFGMGFICSLLSLTPSVYMLEVYDRVVNSRDEITLLMLTILAIGFYLTMELMEWTRAEVMHHASLKIEAKLAPRVFNSAFEAGLRTGRSHIQALRDFRAILDFASSKTLITVMDAPFSLFYLTIVFLIHPSAGAMTLVALLLQTLITYRAEIKTQPALADANKAGIAAQSYAASTLRNAQVIASMGMSEAIFSRWHRHQEEMLSKQAVASEHAGTNSALSKLLQQTLSSGLLALGCILVLNGSIAGGLMIVVSIIGAKSLTPLVQLVSQWKAVVDARSAYGRLNQLLHNFPEKETGMSLPRPVGRLSVEAITAAPPGSSIPILRNVSFTLTPGEALAVVGPSGSGKTSLARLLVGIWPSLGGKVRLDDADVFTWNKEELGPAIGYLPQNIELFDGSILENITRFGLPDEAKFNEAIDLVGLKDFIAALPDGPQTVVGEEGGFLSGGQRQRIGLARAIYGSPSFVVLDEPNSSLDQVGEQALLNTLMTLKSRRTTLVLITHRTNILPVVDKMLVLRDGQVLQFGPRDEVLQALQGPKPAQPPAVAQS